MSEKIIILCPVFNDNTSLSLLFDELDTVLPEFAETTFSILVIDDGSSQPFVISPRAAYSINILHLRRNLGHQKAIATGLGYIKDHLACDKVLIMDCDGEDRPEDAMKLLTASLANPGHIVFGQRQSRQEGQRFVFFYILYKMMFSILTGRRISFGHFLVMPVSLLEKIVFFSEIWNHIPGGIIKSGLPYMAVETHRGKRFAERSKMNFTALLLHGFGAIAVFIDVIASRLLIFSIAMIGISAVTILIIIGIRAFTDLAIPGWASTVVSSLLIVLLQGFLLSLFTIFLYLSSQSQRKFIPAHHYHDYTGSFETIK